MSPVGSNQEHSTRSEILSKWPNPALTRTRSPHGPRYSVPSDDGKLRGDEKPLIILLLLDSKKPSYLIAIIIAFALEEVCVSA